MELYYKNTEHILRVKPFNEFENITDNIVEQLNKIAIQFTKREIQSKALQVISLIKYNVGEDWVTLIHNSKQFKRDSITLNSYIGRYGDVVGTQLHTERINTFTKSVSKDAYVKKHGKKKWQKLCKSKISFSEQHFVEKYGETIGMVKWQETLTKKIKTQKENFKNKKWKNGRTLTEYQDRHGIEDGYKRWKLRNDKQRYRLSREYYIDKFGLERGSVEYRLYVEQNIRNFQSPGGYSKISQRLFNSIYKQLDIKYQAKCKYATNAGEERFFMNNDKLILTDFKCGNKIIEFDGDYWHIRDETKQKDKVKQEFLESKGYFVLRIKESEYNKNKNEVINKCINFINETT